MASVSPSDGGYQSYSRSVSELEDEKDVEIEKSKKRENERIAKLEEAHRRELEKRDRDLADTIRRVKEGVKEDVEKERRSGREELERFKASTYDRFGRYNGLEADELKEQLRASADNAEVERERNKHAAAEVDRNNEERTAELHNDSRKKLDHTVDSMRSAAAETYEKTGRASGAQLEGVKEELKRRADVGEETRNADRKFFKNMSEKTAVDTKEELAQRTRRIDEAAANRITTASIAAQEQVRGSAEEQRVSRNLEGSMMRAQVAELLAHEQDGVKGQAEGRTIAVQEFENDFRAQRSNERSAADLEIAALKSKFVEQDRAFSRLNNDTIRDRDRHYASVIRKQNIENETMQASTRDNFLKEEESLAGRAKVNIANTEKNFERQSNDQRETYVVAMEKMAGASQNTLHRQKDQDRKILAETEKQLQLMKTATGADSIPPAVEEAIRKKIGSEYQRRFEMEQTRNMSGYDRMYKGSNDLLQDEIQKNGLREAQLRRDYESQRQAEQSTFMSHIGDTEFLKDDAIRRKDRESQETSDSLQRTFGKSLERQQRDHDEMMQVTKAQYEGKLGSQRAELEFNLRMAQRTSAARQNELIRDFEKKLADQKVELGARHEDAKTQGELALRDQEREHRRMLDDQARMYEQRLQLADSQTKERERTITKNYEDELEKTRRTHALLVSKKS